ncbi:ParB N-terminal domain-containing protein [Streptomyces sp. NPDC001568]|uniref:ParB N-terminal domain-containing protein n=1 Tax=Streptomyces sp. NPDC001568 TaxID=3364588 RepID=UPI00367F023F
MKTTVKPNQTGPVLPKADVATLVAANPFPPLDVAALTEDIAANGVLEPLYVATTEGGTLRLVEGRRRLVAAAALGLTEVPVTYRPLVSVTALRAHPGNVRQDLRLTPEFIGSISVEGVRTPLVVTRTEGGELRVVDGHRRLAAAIEAKVTHVPYVYEERDEAGQVLDMITTARHRAPLTRSEEQSALFEAAALGAGDRRIAAAGATTLARARTVQKLAKSPTVLAAAAHTTTSNNMPDLETLAMLATLESDDPEAAAQALAELEANPKGNHQWIIRRTLSASKARKEAEAHRAKLDAAGATVRPLSELSDTATRVWSLKDVTAQAHTKCQGHVWALEEGANAYTAYCTNPALYGHETAAGDKGKAKPTAEQRRAVIQGNRDWDTGTEMRAEWLAGHFRAARRPKAVTERMAEITALVLVTGSSVVRRRASHPATHARICTWMGVPEHSKDSVLATTVVKSPAKAQLYSFAAVAAAYEQNTERTVWRALGTTTRVDAAQYLSWLVSLGYQPTPIEQAVIDRAEYKPTVPASGKAKAKR